jgi:hypothetical protein
MVTGKWIPTLPFLTIGSPIIKKNRQMIGLYWLD